VTVSEDAKIKILDLVEGRPIFTLYGPRTGVLATAFSQDGKLFATGGKDMELLIWEPVLIPYSEEELMQDYKENSVPASTSKPMHSSSKIIEDTLSKTASRSGSTSKTSTSSRQTIH
jgi:WD40 repeat protein